MTDLGLLINFAKIFLNGYENKRSSDGMHQF